MKKCFCLISGIIVSIFFNSSCLEPKSANNNEEFKMLLVYEGRYAIFPEKKKQLPKHEVYAITELKSYEDWLRLSHPINMLEKELLHCSKDDIYFVAPMENPNTKGFEDVMKIVKKYCKSYGILSAGKFPILWKTEKKLFLKPTTRLSR